MVEFEGKIANQYVSILIVSGASISYASLKLVELCHLSSIKFKHLWLIQLAIGEKRKVTTKVGGCPIEIGEKLIKVNLNILPVGSYDVLIGIDWLEVHWSLVNYKYKTISFLMDEGNRQEIQGIKRNVNFYPSLLINWRTASEKGAKFLRYR